MRRISLIAALATGLLATAAFAQDPGVDTAPDATIVLSAKAAAVGVGYTWGSGTLVFRGKQYPFDVKGITVADVGFSEITGRGRVYHLNHVGDFSGKYAASTGEATLGQGLGGQILRNGNGVMIRVDDVTKGARLTGAAGGIELTLGK